MKPDPQLDSTRALVAHLSANVLGCHISFRVDRDVKLATGRIFLQCTYETPCTVTGELKEWHGRKWYLSDHMTDDEVVKTAYAASSIPTSASAPSSP